MMHIVTLRVLLISAFALLPVPLHAQALAESDVPRRLFERKGDKIVDAPAEDFALAKTYHGFKDKGVLIAGQRITIMTKKVRYRIGEPVRVLHILEAVEPGIKVFVMGPKIVCDEYADGRLTTKKGPGNEFYRGAVLVKGS